MSKRITAEEINRRLKENHGDTLTLDESTYINSNTRCIFVDKDFGEFEGVAYRVSLGQVVHPKRRSKRPPSARRIPMSTIRERIKKVHGDTVTLDESTYENVDTKCRFIDKELGEWWGWPTNVIGKGSEHPVKGKEKREKRNLEKYGNISGPTRNPVSIEDCHELAKSRGGKFLSDVFKTSNDKYLWECSEGHQWTANHCRIKRLTWCPVCYKKEKKVNLEKCLAMAEENGGKFLSSPEIFDSLTKYEWECSNGHIFEMATSCVKQNHWCPHCFDERSRVSLEKCNKVAKENEGRFLSEEDSYDCKTRYLWECKEKHEPFLMTYGRVKSGDWCPYCCKMNTGVTLEKCNKAAEANGGKLLTKIDIYDCSTKYLWKCKEDHEPFLMNYHCVQSGQWCPACSQKRRVNTMIERYGCSYPMQNRDMALRSAKAKNQITILKHWLTDEDVCCRASYEVRTVGYLNKNKFNYDWQPRTFPMPCGRVYTPDFYFPDEDLWIEIKGFFYPMGKMKWDWFHKEYPNSELWNKEKLKELGII